MPQHEHPAKRKRCWESGRVQIRPIVLFILLGSGLVRSVLGILPLEQRHLVPTYRLFRLNLTELVLCGQAVSKYRVTVSQPSVSSTTWIVVDLLSGILEGVPQMQHVGEWALNLAAITTVMSSAGFVCSYARLSVTVISMDPLQAWMSDPAALALGCNESVPINLALLHLDVPASPHSVYPKIVSAISTASAFGSAAVQLVRGPLALITGSLRVISMWLSFEHSTTTPPNPTYALVLLSCGKRMSTLEVKSASKTISVMNRSLPTDVSCVSFHGITALISNLRRMPSQNWGIFFGSISALIGTPTVDIDPDSVAVSSSKPVSSCQSCQTSTHQESPSSTAPVQPSPFTASTQDRPVSSSGPSSVLQGTTESSRVPGSSLTSSLIRETSIHLSPSEGNFWSSIQTNIAGCSSDSTPVRITSCCFPMTPGPGSTEERWSPSDFSPSSEYVVSTNIVVRTSASQMVSMTWQLHSPTIASLIFGTSAFNKAPTDSISGSSFSFSSTVRRSSSSDETERRLLSSITVRTTHLYLETSMSDHVITVQESFDSRTWSTSFTKKSSGIVWDSLTISIPDFVRGSLSQEHSSLASLKPSITNEVYSKDLSRTSSVGRAETVISRTPDVEFSDSLVRASVFISSTEMGHTESTLPIVVPISPLLSLSTTVSMASTLSDVGSRSWSPSATNTSPWTDQPSLELSTALASRSPVLSDRSLPGPLSSTTSSPPRVQSPIIDQNVLLGRRWRYRIPNDTFLDARDGDASSLTLTYFTASDGQRFQSNNWLLLLHDGSLAGLPLHDDFFDGKSPEFRLRLDARNSLNLSASSLLVIRIVSDMQTNPYHLVNFLFDFQYATFMSSVALRLDISSRMLLALNSSEDWVVLSVTSGSTMIRWYLHSLQPGRSCNFTCFMLFMTSLVRGDEVAVEVQRTFDPYKILSINYTVLGPSPGTSSPTKNILAIILSVLGVVLLLLLAAAFFLCSRRKRGRRLRLQSDNRSPSRSVVVKEDLEMTLLRSDPRASYSPANLSAFDSGGGFFNKALCVSSTDVGDRHVSETEGQSLAYTLPPRYRSLVGYRRHRNQDSVSSSKRI